MSGIYLHYRPAGLGPADLADYETRLDKRAVRRPGDVCARLQTPQLLGAAIHHGVMPSGGSASTGAGALLACGSCWPMADSDRLATPDEILAVLLDRRPRDLEPLRGVFAAALLDLRHDQLSVETDRFGTVPLYWRPDGQGGLRVASEIKFLTEPGHDTLDLDGLADLLAIGYAVRPRTFIAGIHRLPAHHRLVFANGATSTARLPQPGFPRDLPLDAESLGELDRLAQRHFERYKGCGKRHAIALSGGLDSRLLMIAAQRAGLDLVGFTSGEPGNIDVKVSRDLARQYRFPLVAHEVDGSHLPSWYEGATWLHEGRVPPIHLHYFPALHAGVTPPEPQIHGLIGEAVIGGYLDNEKYRQADAAGLRDGCHRFAREARTNWGPAGREAVLGAGLREPAARAHQEAADYLLAELGFSGVYANYLDFRFVYRGGLLVVPSLTGQVQPWTDVISPFLDADIFDFGARLRSQDIAGRVVQLKWGLQFMPGFADLPRVKDGILLPIRDDDPHAYDRALRHLRRVQHLRHLVTRASYGRLNPRHPEGFPHYAQWYRKHAGVRRFVDGILLSERALDRGLWQPDGLRRLLRDLRHGHNLWTSVGAALMVEVLCRQLVDGDGAPPGGVMPGA